MSPHQRLVDQWREFNAINKAASLLNWDQQVFMPPGGAAARAIHIARLTRMGHQVLTGDAMRRALEDAESVAPEGSDEAADCRAVRREVDTQSKIPGDLVERKSRFASEAYLTWRKARAESDFAAMVPHYERLFEVNRELAERLGFAAHPYDPLHDLFEEGATEATTRGLFDGLKEPLKQLAQKAAARSTEDDSFLTIPGSAEALRDWAAETTATLGFDYERGRIDLTTNAFCTTIAVGDVRMASRPKDHVGGVILSSLHEMGHGIYEQNIPADWDRRPIGTGVSLGVHESQSRLWENILGRSEPFWTCFYPSLQARLPSLAGVDADRFRKALNRVQPGPTRIGSDEITYNLHIILRFELECDLMTGKLAVKDLADAWNAKTEDLLGVTPSNSGEGVLQDVHWSRGSVGYFPTYAMGNLIGWQMWETLTGELEGVDDLMARGDYSVVLEWLRERVYAQGKRFKPAELVERVTCEPMKPDAFLRAMRRRYLG